MNENAVVRYVLIILLAILVGGLFAGWVLLNLFLLLL
jgi:hypothetical protein